MGRSPPGLLPGEDVNTNINTNVLSDNWDAPTLLEVTRRVDVPQRVVVDIHPPPPPSSIAHDRPRRCSNCSKGSSAQPENLRSSSACLGEEATAIAPCRKEPVPTSKLSWIDSWPKGGRKEPDPWNDSW